MSHRLSIAGIFLCLLAFGAVAQPITIKPNQRAGDEYRFDQNMVMQLNLSVTANGQQQQVVQNIGQNRAGTVKVISSQDGEPIKATITFEPNSGGFMEMGQGKQDQPFALAGKTVTVTRQADGSYTPEGNLPPEAVAEIANYVKIDAGMFPKHPVSPGDSWDVAPEEFAQAMQMGPSAKGAAKGKLVSVENIGGRQVANIDLTLNISGEQQGAGQMTIQLTGTVKMDVASGRTVGGTLAGPMTIAGQPQPGMDLKGDGKLNFVFKGSVTSTGAAEDISNVPTPLPAPVDKPTPASFAGEFTGEKLSMNIQSNGAGYEGTILMKGKTYPFTAQATGTNLVGKFTVDASAFDFTAAMNADQMTFKTGSSTYDLKRKSVAKNPLED